jgi:hypothetical protein
MNKWSVGPVYFFLIYMIQSCFSPVMGQDKQANNMDTILKVADLIKMKKGYSILGRVKEGEKGKILVDIFDIGKQDIKLKDISEIRAMSSDFQLDIEKKGRHTGSSN